MEVCERASGARMHTALYKPFGFDTTVLTVVFIQDIIQFLSRCSRSLAGAFLGLLNNRSLKSRLSFIGQVSAPRTLSYGLSGLMARGCGEFNDLRLQTQKGYGLYRLLSFRVFIGRRGDNFDRFLIRIKETAECFRLLTQLLSKITRTISPSCASSTATAVSTKIRLTQETTTNLTINIVSKIKYSKFTLNKAANLYYINP